MLESGQKVGQAKVQFGGYDMIGMRLEVGVIDVFISPVHEQKQRKSDKTKKVISVNKSIQALFEIARVLDPMVKRPRGTLQSSWARWCQYYLDPRIERGDYKEKTKRNHV